MDLSDVRHIAEGFRRDLDSLLEEYSSLETFDFTVFSEMWKRRQFSLIYFGRESGSELFEFTQEIFFITFDYLKQATPIHTRAGALYSLYGLYLKQPLDQKCKIRVTQEHWRDIKDLYEYSKEHCIKHLLFVILKLMRLGSFHFVGSNILKGPKSTMTWDLVDENTESVDVHKQPLIELNEACDFDSLSDIHEKYEEKINDFAKKFDIGCKLEENKYLSIKEDFQRLIETDRFSANPNPGPSSSGIGNLRSSLKMKQFSTESISKFNARRQELLGETGGDSNVTPGPLSIAFFDPPSPPIAVHFNKRKYRKKKKIGRPKKNPDPETSSSEEKGEEEEQFEFMEISDVEVVQKPFEKPKRPRHHYRCPKK